MRWGRDAEGLIISSIEIAGSVVTDTTKILAKTRTRVGDSFNAAASAEDAKRIAELESVDYAYYNTTVADGKVKLTYVIVEKLVVRANKI